MIFSCFDAATGGWEYYETEFNSDTDIQFLPNLKIGPKNHKNAFYSLGRDGCIGELKFVEGEVSWSVHKYPFDEKTSLDSYYLVEHDGELVSVFIGLQGEIQLAADNLVANHLISVANYK